jgi:Cu/Ag efflux pump CusA
MPVAAPDVSNAEMKRILQVQDKIIKSLPEVKTVLGKAGRASSATDNSPVNMIETIILLKPKKEWRDGVSKEINNKISVRIGKELFAYSKEDFQLYLNELRNKMTERGLTQEALDEILNEAD